MTEILALIARPFDSAAETAVIGPPVPMGAQPMGGEIAGFSRVGDLVAVYASAGGYVSRPTDNPADTVFADRLTIAFNYSVRAFRGIEAAGRTDAGTGVIELANGDGALDAALGHGWDGRRIEIWKGEKGAAFGTFALVFSGTTAGLTFDTNVVRLRLRDRQAPFTRAIQTLVYAGTGGYDGGADLAGKYRPVALGEGLNVPAVPIDPINLVFQVHFRRIEEVTEVRDKGVALDLDPSVGTAGDCASYEDLAAAAIGAGKYATCRALGLFRLGASPDGTVTADIKGDAAGGYVATTGTIVRRIITQLLGADNFSDPTDLDAAAFAQMETDQPAAVGFWVGTDAVTAGQVIDELMTAIAGYWVVKLTGKFSLAILKEPAGTPDLALAPANLGLDTPGIARQGSNDNSVLPSWRRALGYQPVFTVQTPDQLAAAPGVSDSDRAFYGARFRYATASDSGVRTKHPLARDVRVNGYFASQVAAQTEADRQQALYGPDRGVYAVAPESIGDFEIELGMLAKISGITRFGFTDPQLFRVVGLEVDAGTGKRIAYLWG